MGERKMSIEKEIERAVKRTIALDKDTPYKSAAEQEKIISDIKSAFNDATFHFENSKSLMLNQSGKKRLVKQYDNLYSPENILCQSIKQILDRAFKIKYPNRNKTTRTLFSVLSAAIQNKPEESLFNWKGIKNFADQITYRTYQRTVFKRYRKNTYGLYASLD